MPSSSNWQIAYKEIQNLLKQLNAYIDCNDWVNVDFIKNKLLFKICFEPVYEEEHQKVLHIGKEKKI